MENARIAGSSEPRHLFYIKLLQMNSTTFALKVTHHGVISGPIKSLDLNVIAKNVFQKP